MMSHLGNHLRAVRLTQHLTLPDLARLCGYSNARKVAARIAVFERDGTVKEELLARLADALGVDFPSVEALQAQDGPLDAPAALPASFQAQEGQSDAPTIVLARSDAATATKRNFAQ